MHSLFRTFSARRVRFLVIGGQASILYGAAHFSQDLDVWIDGAPDNVTRFLRALESLHARVHKLTPPLTRAHLQGGHGFHFVVPQADGDLYLDMMARPPRVGPFAPAWRRASRLATPWGRLPVAAIEDLVEMKKTNRPGDYDVITRLAIIRLGRTARPGRRLLGWALANVFRVEDLEELVRRFGVAAEGLSPRREPAQAALDAAARRLASRAQRLQELGRRYWLPRIQELRELRAAQELLLEGTPVTKALRS